VKPGEIREHLDLAASLAEEAGKLALRWFRRPHEMANKAAGAAAFDPVTEADREVETFLRGELSRRFPDHRIVGEEAGESGGPGPLRWLIDPIDGTRAFISGVPLWGTLVGLDDGERCLAGVACMPYLRETFLGDGRAAWMRREGTEVPLKTRSTETLAEAILYCTHPDTLQNERDRGAFGHLARACRMLRYGGDCYSYCLLALGLIDLVVEGSLKPYDVIPLVPIVEGAGGVMSDSRGESAVHGGMVVAAASRRLHEQALAILKEG
jgi:histidinol phosphatase-like enzyme (inositol monophosphatase family)